MKKLVCILLICLLLSGCNPEKKAAETVTYLDVFDTVTTIVGDAGAAASDKHGQ